MIDLPIVLLRTGAAVPGRAYDGDAGLDLASCARVTLAPGERAVVPTGVAVEIPDGHAGLVVPRSGLAAEHGISIVNAPGLIDAGYRGEVLVILHNSDSERPFTVEPGMRIAQLVVVAVPQLRLLPVEELSTTDRGARGHGSSGR